MRKNIILLTITALLLLTVVLLFVFGGKGLAVTPANEANPPESEDIREYLQPSGALSAKLNIIYDFDSEEGQIHHVLFEVLSPAHERLSYIVLPSGSRYFCSDTLYRELSLSLVTVPQMITFEEMYEYYGSEEAFAAGAKVAGELCGIKDSYYTVMDPELFGELFEVTETPLGASVKVAAEVETVKRGSGSVKAYLTELCEKVNTDWSLSDRLVYLELFDKLSDKSILTFAVPGSRSGLGWEIDFSELRRLTSDII